MHHQFKTVLVTASVIASGAACMWLITSMPRSESSASAAAVLLSSTQQVSPLEVEMALINVGLDAESLTAAGVTNSGLVSAVVAGVRAQLAATLTNVSAVERVRGDASQAVATLEQRVQSGTGTGEDVTALIQARAALNTANAQRSEFYDGLFSAGVFTLSTDQQSKLAVIRGNRAKWTLPVEFLTVQRTEVAWVALRAWLAAERIQQQRGEQLDSAVATSLAEVRQDSAVATASANLATHLEATRQTWTAALASTG